MEAEFDLMLSNDGQTGTYSGPEVGLWEWSHNGRERASIRVENYQVGRWFEPSEKPVSG